MKNFFLRIKKLILLVNCYWKSILFLSVLSLLSGISGILLPYLSRFLIDNLGGGRAMGTFAKLMVFGVFLGAVRWGMSALSTYKSARIRQGMSYELQCRVMDKYLSLPLLKAEEVSSGDFITVLFSDVSVLVGFAVGQIPSLTMASVQFVGSLLVLFYWDVVMGLLVLGGAPLYFYFAVRRTSDLGDIFSNIQKTNARLTAQIVRLIEGVRLWKSSAMEREEWSKFSGCAQDLKDLNIKMSDRNLQISFRLKALSYGSGLVVLGVGGLRVLGGHISVGQLVATLAFMAFLRGPLDQISAMMRSLHSVFVSLDRMENLLDMEGEETHDREGVSRIDTPVVLKDISFSYGREPVLRGFSLALSPGEMVGLKGPSGVGKTTVALILAGLLYPQKGEVMVNGWPLDRVDIRSYRRRVGLVLQREILFPGTIRENIAYGKPQASEEEVRWAAQMACIHSFVESLDSGYSTVLGERGLGLSQGQRQRIAIARELLKDPDLLILDEATASLDIRTEEEVLKNIKKLGKTTLLVSHRDTALRVADRVVELVRMKVIPGEGGYG